MASKTKIVKRRRAIRKAKAGKKRKNFAYNHGSTAPNLPLTVPNSNERALQKKQATNL